MKSEVYKVAIQGKNCPREVMTAIAELDTTADINVIVATHGGGAFEDLLGFSDEGVVRATFAAQTPVVSTMGCEEGTSLLSFVTDFRASTPTNVIERVIPDYIARLELMERRRRKMRQTAGTRIPIGLGWLQAMRSRPVTQNLGAALEQRRGDTAHDVKIMHARIAEILAVFRRDLAVDRTTLIAIPSHVTLERGYAVLRISGRALVIDAITVKKGDLLEVVLAQSPLVASVVGTNSDTGTAQ